MQDGAADRTIGGVYLWKTVRQSLPSAAGRSL